MTQMCKRDLLIQLMFLGNVAKWFGDEASLASYHWYLDDLKTMEVIRVLMYAIFHFVWLGLYGSLVKFHNYIHNFRITRKCV